MSVMLVPTDRKTVHIWHSMRQICDRVIATLERREDFPRELELSPRQALVKIAEQVSICRRILRLPATPGPDEPERFAS